MKSVSAAAQAPAPRERRHGTRFRRGRDRADSQAQRARAADHATPRREREPPPQRSGGRAPIRREHGGTAQRATQSASAVPQAAAPRERRDGDRFQRGRDRANRHAQRARTADHSTTRREREPPPRRNGGRAPSRRERVGTVARATRSASAVPQAAVLRERRDGDRPQRGCDRADSHAQRARAADQVVLCQDHELSPRRNGG